jgi:hypothetical protein
MKENKLGIPIIVNNCNLEWKNCIVKIKSDYNYYIRADKNHNRTGIHIYYWNRCKN